MHTGQRDIFRIRITKDAVAAGFKLHHLGEVIYTMLMNEFGSVVDKCQVTLVTDEAKVQEILDKVARPKYEARDERVSNMTDEGVDTFYTCILCQSFSPS
ncbi:MAG: CO dehydrogenase/CO-methylating acetyl-CoA synthase complex subunit beta, partial [Eubacteriaceae bacterium]|nr:CO dehydrogenase/CO-methylating acetyl-CoA synthase complex subunit beta [Eubacteriaceae bacterium]